MNTTPKQQDDEGTAASDEARPPLEQTVMGIAPTLAASPTEPPPPLSPTGSNANADVVILAAPTIAVADDEAPAGSAETDAARIGAVAQADAAPTDHPIAPATPRTDVSISTDLPASVEAPPAPTLHAPRLGETLPLAWSPPSAPTPEPVEQRPTSALAVANGGLDHTALSADYLQAAREAALAAVASGMTRSDGSHGDAPRGAVPIPTPPKPPDLDRPSDVGTRPSIAAPLPGAATGGAERSAPGVARGFEPVPVVRAPLADSLSGALSPLVEFGGHRNLPPSTRPRLQSRRRDSVGRWLLLASVALSTVGIVTLASTLVNRYRNSPTRAQAIATGEGLAADLEAPIVASPSAASQALMPNRPAPERATVDGRPRVIFATGAPGETHAAERATAGSAGPESQLAATAGRHVLSGNYAEALPLYRELERSWPENTAYAAMARLLEKRVGSTNDTRTISPTLPKP